MSAWWLVEVRGWKYGDKYKPRRACKNITVPAGSAFAAQQAAMQSPACHDLWERRAGMVLPWTRPADAARDRE